MARRSIFVAAAALAVALVPAAAQAATIQVNSAQFASPVALQWNVTAVLTETVFRANGACASANGPIAGATGFFTSTGVAVPPSPPPATTTTDAPGEGTFCYYVQDDGGLANSNTVQVTVDTANPTATIAVTPTGAPNFLRGTVNITSTSADTGSGVASSVLHEGGVGACEAGPGILPAWVTTGVADGTYDLCNVVTDNAAHTATATQTVVVDNTIPTGAVAAPAAGAIVTGPTVGLSTDAVDATAGIRNVQWRWAVGAGAQHNIGAPVIVATGGWARLWNTSTVPANQRPPDGAVTVSALVTDMAGNVLTISTPVVVDNTAPDVKAVLTAPPAVAGSPTLIWTPAHDAVGITRYEVLRGGNVIATVASTPGAQTFSYSDKSAPDQATSSYVVRAWDGAAHSVDSNAVGVLVDSTAVTAAKGLTAATPTSSAPVLTWAAPSSFAVNHYDVYRDGLLVGSTPGAGATFTDATATEGTHDYAVLARDAAAKPGVLSASFKVVFDKTAPTSGGAPTAQVLASGQVNLVWPAAGDALSGVAGYIVRRTGGGVAPAAADGGTAVCTPAQPGCSDVSAATGTWSYGVFARDGAGNVALIGTVANVVVVDKTPPLAPTKLTVTRPKSKKSAKSVTLTLHWIKPTAADLDRVVVVLNLKRAPVGPADGKAVYKGLATSAKVRLLPGQVGYFAIYAYDHSGNYSRTPLRKKVSLASLISLRPLSGSDVSLSTPVLTWKAAKGSTYYNVQVFRNGKHVVVGWPSKASYRIPPGMLKSGTYVWYVWPAVQHAGGSPTFGKLIGRATFTYTKK